MTANCYKKRIENFTAKLRKHDDVARTNVLSHKKTIPISLFGIVVVLVCAWLFGLFTTLSVALVETLVNVNIALFGFFLAFAVYIYNSYESRINKLELSIVCYEQELIYATDWRIKSKFNAVISIYNKKVDGLRDRRDKSSHLIILTAFVLLLSLTFSLVFLGAIYADTTATRMFHFEPVSFRGQVLLYTILSCLTFGIIMIFILVVNISRKYPPDKTQKGATDAQQSS
jgi:hypothetical protein